MATVELTLEQLREAIVQLPPAQRQRLIAEIGRIPSEDDARRSARQVRGTFRMNARQRRRMSDLLAKGNEGTLTVAESQELDHLVDEFEQRTLEMARAMTASGTPG